MTETLDVTRQATLGRRLRQRYRDLWADVQRELGVGEPYAALAGEAHDAGDEATADVLIDLNLADIHRDIGEMRDIQNALQRLSSGSYGTCPDCGEAIAFARLSANPAAERCVPCQTRYEHQHVSRIGPTL